MLRPAWSRTLLLIYERDSEQHLDVVRRLAQLLGTRCNFRVVSEMTRQGAVRRSKADFVLDAFREADVVLVVVSEDLRAAWLARRHDNTSTPFGR